MLLEMEPRKEKCSRRSSCCGPSWFFGKKSLLGVVCIVVGILVTICFVPSWLAALIIAFILFAIGVSLIGIR